VALLCCLQALPAAAEKRVAFVVGIDRYDNLSEGLQLKKAANDATAVGDTMRDLGYEVIRAPNVGRVEFLRQWNRFLNALEPGGTAMFFFAGDGEEEVLKGAALKLDTLLDGFRARKPAVSLIVLDACRDNPFVTSRGRSLGGSRGLADVRAPSGTFIMYSAGAGQRAIDRLSETDPDANSIYTRALLPKLKTPGLGIQEIAREVRRAVMETARTVGHEQVPAYYDEVTGDFCPAGCTAPAATTEAKAIAEARAKAEAERQRLALLQQEAERLRAEVKRRAEEAKRKAEAARPDPALSVTPGSGQSFRDCPECPEMVVVPAGSFVMGSPASEKGLAAEGPQHRVTIARPFAVGKFEVTQGEFETFVRESDRFVGDWCWTFEGGKLQWRSGRSFRHSGFVQHARHPAVCVSWDDASPCAS
jgi:uncharacterized caspase-like protein